MVEMINVDHVIRHLPRVASPEVPAPPYSPNGRSRRVMLGCESMRRHMADAGWQLTVGLEHAGYELWGRDFPNDEVHVPTILEKTQPGTVVVQDKREWEGRTANYSGPDQSFREVTCLRDRNDIFKLTVLKDAQNGVAYHRQSADEMGVHAWITYYHPRIVKHVAPYVRTRHLVRTNHTVDPDHVPKMRQGKQGCLVSGAVSDHYPLRQMFARNHHKLPECDYRKHPRYHAHGCVTPRYLQTLSRYKVAVCTSSRYGYSLRKIVEATACGCIVLTDLPVDDKLPEIDDNLVRIAPPFKAQKISQIILRLYEQYNYVKQQEIAERCVAYYSWRATGDRLASNIESMRRQYVI